MARLVAPLALLAAVLARQAWCGTDAEGLKFLEENKRREEVVVRPSGLQYEILKSGPEAGPHPNASSKCVCHYRGALLSGVEFDSSYKRNSPATFQPNQVVKGWTEALQLMRAGDKWKLFIPSDLGYGDRGSGSTIPGGAVLVFELELLEVKVSGSPLESIADMVKQNPMILIIVLYVGYTVYSQFFTSVGGGKELALSEASAAKENHRVFLQIQIGGADPCRVEMELFTKHYPKTAENFRALCTGEKGVGRSMEKLWFKDSSFHRIIPEFMIQGGDFTRGNGTGGESIYGEKFEDEWTHGYVAHSKAGLLSMANAGKNTNGSQFFITLAPCQHLDGKHVIFGQVTDGMDVVTRMGKVGSRSGATLESVVVVDCGEIVKDKTT